MIPFKKAREIRGHRVFAKLQAVTRGYATPAVSIFSDVSLFVSLLLRDGKWKPRKGARLTLANLRRLKRQKIKRSEYFTSIITAQICKRTTYRSSPTQNHRKNCRANKLRGNRYWAQLHQYQEISL